MSQCINHLKAITILAIKSMNRPEVEGENLTLMK